MRLGVTAIYVSLLSMRVLKANARNPSPSSVVKLRGWLFWRLVLQRRPAEQIERERSRRAFECFWDIQAASWCSRKQTGSREGRDRQGRGKDHWKWPGGGETRDWGVKLRTSEDGWYLTSIPLLLRMSRVLANFAKLIQIRGWAVGWSRGKPFSIDFHPCLLNGYLNWNPFKRSKFNPHRCWHLMYDWRRLFQLFNGSVRKRYLDEHLPALLVVDRGWSSDADSWISRRVSVDHRPSMNRGLTERKGLVSDRHRNIHI